MLHVTSRVITDSYVPQQTSISCIVSPMPAVLVAWRNRRSTALRILAPFIFLILALIVNLALNANNQIQERLIANPTAVISDISSIPSCETDLYIAGRSCIDFVYSPDNDDTVNVSRVVRAAV